MAFLKKTPEPETKRITVVWERTITVHPSDKRLKEGASKKEVKHITKYLNRISNSGEAIFESMDSLENKGTDFNKTRKYIRAHFEHINLGLKYLAKDIDGITAHKEGINKENQDLFINLAKWIQTIATNFMQKDFLSDYDYRATLRFVNDLSEIVDDMDTSKEPRTETAESLKTALINAINAVRKNYNETGAKAPDEKVLAERLIDCVCNLLKEVDRYGQKGGIAGIAKELVNLKECMLFAETLKPSGVYLPSQIATEIFNVGKVFGDWIKQSKEETGLISAAQKHLMELLKKYSGKGLPDRTMDGDAAPLYNQIQTYCRQIIVKVTAFFEKFEPLEKEVEQTEIIEELVKDSKEIDELMKKITETLNAEFDKIDSSKPIIENVIALRKYLEGVQKAHQKFKERGAEENVLDQLRADLADLNEISSKGINAVEIRKLLKPESLFARFIGRAVPSIFENAWKPKSLIAKLRTYANKDKITEEKFNRAYRKKLTGKAKGRLRKPQLDNLNVLLGKVRQIITKRDGIVKAFEKDLNDAIKKFEYEHLPDDLNDLLAEAKKELKHHEYHKLIADLIKNLAEIEKTYKEGIDMSQSIKERMIAATNSVAQLNKQLNDLFSRPKT